MSSKDVATSPEHPVHRIVGRFDGVREGQGVFVGRSLDTVFLQRPHLVTKGDGLELLIG